MNKTAVKLLTVLTIVLASSSPARPQDFVQSYNGQSGESTIDYIHRRIVVTGKGASRSADESIAGKKLWALIEARKNCISRAAAAIGDIGVESKTFLEAGKIKGTNISVRIQSFVRGIKALEERTETLKDGSVLAAVSMVIDFDGNDGLNKLLFSTLFPTERPKNAEKKASGAAAHKKEKITGFVFDVRGLRIRPSLTPRIYSESGDLIYGADRVSRDNAVQYGIAAYTRGIKGVIDRVGKNPLTVEVLGIRSGDNSSILISKEEAARLQRLDQHYDIFASCGVAFLIR